MSKENLKEYFRHDYHARNHVKFAPLLMEMSMEGMGIYWCVVEMLYEEGGTIMRSHYDSIAYDLRIDKNKLIKIVEGYKLFDVDEEKFWSRKVIARLKERSEKSKKAAKSAKKRWSQLNAKAMRSHSEGNAIIEDNRIEENRIVNNIVASQKAPPSKTIDDRQKDFYDSLIPFTGSYGKELIREFYEYWTEKNPTGKKMKFEMQRTFEVTKRLVTWDKKSKEFSFTKKQKVNPGKLQ